MSHNYVNSTRSTSGEALSPLRMRRLWAASATTSPPATPSLVSEGELKGELKGEVKGEFKGELRLSCEAHFERRRTFLGAVWVIRCRRVSWISTFLNLYLLLNAFRALHGFQPLRVDDYAIISLGDSDACLHTLRAPPAAPSTEAMNVTAPSTLFDTALGTLRSRLMTLQHDFQSAAKEAGPRTADLATVMRECRSQLSSAAESATGLQQAKHVYWCVAYGFVGIVLCLDALRWCGCCSSLVDAALGYRSSRIERLRLGYIWLMLLPFAHLSWLIRSPIPLPCCEGTPKLESVMDRLGVLAWLSILVSYCLFSDSHNNGYFLLRSHDAGTCRLLRPHLTGVSTSSLLDAKGGSAV